MVFGPPVQWSWKGLFVTGVGILGTGSVEASGGAVTTGITGIVGDEALGPTVLANGDTFRADMGAQELTPRFAISQESSGIPTLGLPPGVVGVVDVGVDGDAGGPLEPVPHIPDTPTVPIAEVAAIPAIGNVPGSVGATDGAGIPAICVLSEVAVAPAVAAVAVIADPIAIPPPS
jgi:hypothetical protein